MVQLYKTLFVLCMQSMIPNQEMVGLLPEHQQAYILKGSMAACYVELESQRMLACAEDPKFCVDK